MLRPVNTVALLVAATVATGCGGSPARQPSASTLAPSAAPAPAPDTTAAVPCFPDRTTPLSALDMYRQLEKHAMGWMMDEDERPPPEPYGTCRVENNQIVAADGSLVAELNCGVRVLVPGIIDDLGLSLGTGARGQDVLDRTPTPRPSLTCWANGTTQTRCRFDRRDDTDTDTSAYVVAGRFPGDALTGDEAVAFFAPRELVELDVSIWCH